MAFRNYNNNNQNGPSNTTYSGISFFNSESKVNQSRFSISYFNKIMKIQIANKIPTTDGSNKYDDNPATFYLSNMKAYALYRELRNMLDGKSKFHNICQDQKNQLLKISDGTEYGTSNFCVAILVKDEMGQVTETVYETKDHSFTANYDGKGNFETVPVRNQEIETIAMAFIEYYKASAYAIAASVMEAGMYKRQAQYDRINQIAEKVGVPMQGSGNGFYGGGRSGGSFLDGANSGGNGSRGMDPNSMNPPKGFEASNFDSLAESLDDLE
jgi:hypothetical protein